MTEEFLKCGILDDITTAARRVANCANSLIHDVTNNCAELYNALVAKLVGGKRITFSFKIAYQGRCHAVVISHNATGEELHEVIRKTTKNSNSEIHYSILYTAEAQVIRSAA